MSIQLFIVITYIVALFAISFHAKKQADKGSSGFLFASYSMGSTLVAANISGMAIGAAATIGVAENAFTMGMGAGWYTAAWAIGALIMGVVAAGRYRELKCTTIPELFERYYDTKGRLVAVIGLIVIQMVITSLQYLAGGAILASLLPDIFTFEAGMIVSAVVFIGITFIGGLWSSARSNLLSVAIIYVGIVYAAFAALSKAGGIQKVASQLPPTIPWFSPAGGLSVTVIISWIVVMSTQAITAQGPVQIACGAKDATTARRGFLIGSAVIFPVGFICALLGIIARVTYPEITSTLAMPRIIMDLSPVASGITLAALWAADVSTACTILLGAGTLFSQDIYKRFISPEVSEEKYLWVSKISVLVIGIITLWFAFNAKGIVKTMLAGLSISTAFTVVFLFTVFIPSLCRKNSAFVTTLVGLVAILAWQFVPALKVFREVIYLEWVVCTVAFLAVPFFDKQKIKKLG